MDAIPINFSPSLIMTEYEQEIPELTEADWIVLKRNTGSKYNNEALIKKRIFKIQEEQGFSTTFDFLLEELDQLVKEINREKGISFTKLNGEQILVFQTDDSIDIVKRNKQSTFSINIDGSDKLIIR